MKNFYFIIILFLVFSPNIVFAQVPESQEEIERVQRIKDIVASKVAELNLVEKKGIIATVAEVGSTEIKATDYKGTNVIIDVDELTNFDFETDGFGISDLEVGSTYSFVGLFNKDSGKLLARFISEINSIPQYIDGAISEKNEDDFQVSVVTSEGNVFIFDIENSTDTMLIDTEGNLESSGFSGLTVGQRVIAIGFNTEENEISATRIIHFSQIPPSTEVLANLGTQITTATGSGNTLEVMGVE